MVDGPAQDRDPGRARAVRDREVGAEGGLLRRASGRIRPERLQQRRLRVGEDAHQQPEQEQQEDVGAGHPEGRQRRPPADVGDHDHDPTAHAVGHQPRGDRSDHAAGQHDREDDAHQELVQVQAGGQVGGHVAVHDPEATASGGDRGGDQDHRRATGPQHLADGQRRLHGGRPMAFGP